MWKIGIAVVITVYLMVALSILLAIKITKVAMREKKLSLPMKRAIHVVVLTLSIYLVPIIGLSICLACYEQAVGFIILGIFLSFLPVTNYVIIPLSDKKYITLIEKEFGKDSEIAKNLRKQHKKNVKIKKYSEKGM